MELELLNLELKKNIFCLKKKEFPLFFDHNELLLRKSKMILSFEN